MKNQKLKKLQKLQLSADVRYFFKRYGRIVSTLRRDPIVQARLIHGIIVPPHERNILRVMRYPYREYHIIASRGSAKSFTCCSLAPTLKSEVFASRKLMSLSASKFRGGKIIMEEALSLVMGRLGSQQQNTPFIQKMLTHKSGLKRETDRWFIPFSTNTSFITVPTGNEETIRGQRAHDLYLDEADNWDSEVISKIVKPFLAVNLDFETPGRTKDINRVVYTGTVSHIHKDWAKKILERLDLIQKKYEAYKALYRGEFDEANRLFDDNNGRVRHSSVVLQRWDYTDLIIPTKLKNHDVFYPSFNRAIGEVEINSQDLIKYDPVDGVDYIYTYPIEKTVADDEIADGLTDFDTWAAEWRCQFIESSGNVYPHDIIEKATNTELLDVEDYKKTKWNVEDLGPHYPPLLYSCSDPCVLGVDPARTDDFTAFVVIRLGQLAEGDYNPHIGTGNTPWNNVIWAEQKRNMTIRDIAEKIRELKSRYNLIVNPNPDLAIGICIDARGAASGATVRDELANPSAIPDEFGNINPNWKKPQLIYDTTDKEYDFLKLNKDAWPGLRLLWTNDKINTELVSYSKGQLETSHIYIAKRVDKRFRNDPDGRLNVGYVGVESLKNQLLAIQAVPTQYHQKFMIPGNSKSMHVKKDLFSAFLYACYAARGHLLLMSKKHKNPPTTAGILVRPGSYKRSKMSNLMRY